MLHRLINLIIFTCISLSLSVGISAAPIQLTSTTDSVDLKNHFDVFEDKTATLTIEDIKKISVENKFTPLKGNLNAGFTNSTYWLKLELNKNDDQTPSQWWLELSPAFLDDIRLYTPTNAQEFTAQQGGDHLPYSAQSFSHRLPMFIIDLNKSTTQTFYLRIQTTSTLSLRANLYTPKAFAESTNKESNFIGIFYGVMLAMIAYNIILLLSFPDRAMIYYQILSILTLFAGLIVNGHFGLLIAPNSPWLVDILTGASMPMIVFTNSLFFTHFLTLKNTMPQIHLLFRSIQLFAIIAFFIVLSGHNHQIAPFIQVTAFLQVLIVLIISIIFALRGYRPGVILSVASTAWIAGGTLLVLRNIGVLEPSWITDFGFQIGAAIEVVLLGIAQADRINIIKNENEIAQNQLLLLAREHERELEDKVIKRTNELEKIVELLKKLDSEKNEFLGIASHDLKNPLTSIIGMSDLLLKMDQQISQEQRKNYLERISSSGRRMLNIITDLLDINAFESGHTKIALISIDLHVILCQVLQQYENNIRDKKLQLKITSEKSIFVLVDSTNCFQILDNLVSNAIKYSPLNETITSTLACKDGYGSLAIHNAGPGLTEEDQQQLFGKFSKLSTRPTAGEHSSGLGLSIVKKLTESMNGDIQCESELGKGCTFIVRFPLSDIPSA